MVAIKTRRFFYNSTRKSMLASDAAIADNFFLRLKGLLGTEALADGEGIYITPCSSIHMFGMHYAIDALFIDRSGAIVGLVENIQPGKMSAFFPRAAGCLEVPSGTIQRTGTACGDNITSGDSREIPDDIAGGARSRDRSGGSSAESQEG